MTNHKSDESLPKAASGFTLAETVVAVFVFVLIMTGVMSVFIMSLRSWKEGSRDLSLQSSGRLIIEKIVRGPGGRFGLREASEESITVDPDGSGITFLVDKNSPPTYDKSDDTEVRISLEGNSIVYDPSTEVYGDEMPIVGFGKVEEVRFEIDGKAVKIDLWMKETSGMTDPSQVKFQTKVFLRKSENPDTET